jgi:hypothetical protein
MSVDNLPGASVRELKVFIGELASVDGLASSSCKNAKKDVRGNKLEPCRMLAKLPISFGNSGD